MSIVFDRAVSYYDRTRALSAEVTDRLVESLIREAGLAYEDPILELGIGTGRIGLPLAGRLRRVYGVDLSLPMMVKLKQNPEAGARVALALADVTVLPFPENCFRAIYGVHVLHLVKGWQQALREARRVLAPGGTLLISWRRREPDSLNRKLRNELRRRVLEHGVDTTRPGAQTEEEILEELGLWPGGARVVDVVDWTEETTPREALEEINQQIYSETWFIPRRVLDTVMPGLREFTISQIGPLDLPIVTPYNFRWLIASK